MLQLDLAKPGDAPRAPFKLNLAKSGIFKVEAFWADGSDCDVHALMLRNQKIAGVHNELLTYAAAPAYTSGYSRGKPFALPGGALSHSGDARDGSLNAVDEIITIDGPKVPADVTEIALFLTLYDAGKKFGNVAQAGIRIVDDTGKVLQVQDDQSGAMVAAEIQVSTGSFAAYSSVQLGSLVRGADGGWEFKLAGSGIDGDLNKILELLS